MCVQAAAWDAARFFSGRAEIFHGCFDSNGKNFDRDGIQQAGGREYPLSGADCRSGGKGEIPIPAIAGKLYLKDGKMILHPLEIFQWGTGSQQTGSVCR